MLAGRPAWDVDITSGWFVIGMAVATAGTAFATVWFWNRPTLQRTRRVCTLLFTQLMVTFTILAAVNAQMYFYSTLSDLMHIADGPPVPDVPVSTVKVKHLDPRPAVPFSDDDGKGLPFMVTKPTLTDQPRPPHNRRHGADPKHGVLVHTSIQGPRTGYRLDTFVYLPAAYFAPEHARTRFPVIQLASGFPGTPDTWLRRMKVHQMLSGLMESGRMPPTIVVIAAQNPIEGRDSECVDASSGARADTYLGLDVPDAIAANFRTAPAPTNWGVMGYSTGGFCAANLALRHPDRYAAAASLSGYFKAITDMTTGDLYKGDEALRRANSPLYTIDDPRTAPARMYLFAAKGEGKAAGEAREFAKRFKPTDTVKVRIAPSGGHNFGTWAKGLPEAFEWLAGEIAVRPGGRAPDPSPVAEPPRH
ncbi:alpha/beta hydrolase [Embleya sp. NBC_00896]|uniref:alpha/beta hydrolase n=1 Tax=Embleya sp. NBC_00896 TaxID=2975961 RepID=UPI00386806C6|nr:esterase family protein [Embleya sp. NBC_00896]